MMKFQKLVTLSLLLSVFCANLLVFPSLAQDEQEHKLRLSISIRNDYLLPIQRFPITVLFEIENIGNETFNGKATLEVETEKHSYTSKTFYISNLTKGEVYNNSTSYETDDEGRYWATVKIEADDLSRIFLYVGSTLEENAMRVKYTDSVFLYSLSISIAIFVALVTAIGVIIAYFRYRRKNQS